ncbi:MAG: DUF4906 domain-containing protein [Bacteroidales bacterium]|nr:DUF4906 domain-containing protein [Bacteroidales bacterium]
MKKSIFFSLFAAAAVLCSCQKEIFPVVDEVVEEGLPTTVEIPFCFDAQKKVSTKVTLGESFEGTLYNLYLAIYDSDGKVIFTKFYEAGDSDWSHVQANDAGQGSVKVTTHTTNNASVYAVANIEVAMLNLDAEKLKIVGQTEAGLRSMVAKLNQDIISSDGFFLMSGWLKGVNLTTSGLSVLSTAKNSNGETGSSIKLHLDRLNAKVTFNVTCASPEYPAHSPTIESFIPKKWQVVNVPRRAYLMPGVDTNDYASFGSSEDNYFDMPAYGTFHTTAGSGKYNVDSWSFYTIESLLKAKSNGLSGYEDRELQEKDSMGKNGAWVYAPDYGTYVILTGTVMMSNATYDTSGALVMIEGTTLSAEVQYKIHLGDFGHDVTDFGQKRNTHYIYNVTIRGVDDITIEVVTSDEPDLPTIENAPGATGDVTIAKEAFRYVDSHYESFYHGFKSSNITSNLTWFVRTPFSNGQASDSPADYKWIKFRVNEMGADGKYKKNRRLFKPYDESYVFDYTANYSGAVGSTTESPVMTVKELVAYLKKQNELKAAGSTNFFDAAGEIGVTVFVDENYYEEDPRDGTADPELWKKFAGSNVNPRVMHILSRTMSSDDEESLVTASSLSIKQRPIQTVYNVYSDVKRAWGVESLDESPVRAGMRWRSGADTRAVSLTTAQNDMPRFSTLREWAVYLGNGNWDTPDWSTYLNQETDGTDTLRFTSSYNYLAYMCMQRNRDNNGNGKIDRSEMRWYLASGQQIACLWVGENSLAPDAKYYRPKDGYWSDKVWRSHYITSTANRGSTNVPMVVWAEEYGATGGHPQSNWDTGSRSGSYRGFIGPYHIRCVRDLNSNLSAARPEDEENRPEPLIQKSGSNATGWKLDLSRLSEENFREFRDKELIFGDEKNVINNRVARAFETSTTAQYTSFSESNFLTINNNLTTIGLGGTNPYCPSGYRLPNNREISILFHYLPNDFWTSGGVYLTRTWWSRGYLGDKTDIYLSKTEFDNHAGTSKRSTIGVRNNIITTDVSEANTSQLRCVKDTFSVSVED